MVLYWRHKCDSLVIFVLNYDDYKGSRWLNKAKQSGFSDESPFAPDTTGWESPVPQQKPSLERLVPWER